ncbi:proline-rich protein 2-like [Archocentrus centrarchus]|uniref:proline-rich protein 2-like n=1 Tax=Archocentrus centrarchus TaxID=63155 RepID=UPI0011EA01AD|nr:proline-rich protein 2-like [Archocentrus centrarchus]
MQEGLHQCLRVSTKPAEAESTTLSHPGGTGTQKRSPKHHTSQETVNRPKNPGGTAARTTQMPRLSPSSTGQPGPQDGPPSPPHPPPPPPPDRAKGAHPTPESQLQGQGIRPAGQTTSLHHTGTRGEGGRGADKRRDHGAGEGKRRSRIAQPARPIYPNPSPSLTAPNTHITPTPPTDPKTEPLRCRHDTPTATSHPSRETRTGPPGQHPPQGTPKDRTPPAPGRRETAGERKKRCRGPQERSPHRSSPHPTTPHEAQAAQPRVHPAGPTAPPPTGTPGQREHPPTPQGAPEAREQGRREGTQGVDRPDPRASLGTPTGPARTPQRARPEQGSTAPTAPTAPRTPISKRPCPPGRTSQPYSPHQNIRVPHES